MLIIMLMKKNFIEKFLMMLIKMKNLNLKVFLILRKKYQKNIMMKLKKIIVNLIIKINMTMILKNFMIILILFLWKLY